jgi:hypothetical protein
MRWEEKDKTVTKKLDEYKTDVDEISYVYKRKGEICY